MTLVRDGTQLKVQGLVADPPNVVDTKIKKGSVDLSLPENAGSLRFRCATTVGDLTIEAFTVTTNSEMAAWVMDKGQWVSSTIILSTSPGDLTFRFDGLHAGASNAKGPSGTVIVRPRPIKEGTLK